MWESTYTAQLGSGQPRRDHELVVFPRHLLSSVAAAMLTRGRSLPVTSDCVFFRGGQREEGGGPRRRGQEQALLGRELACPAAHSSTPLQAQAVSGLGRG